MRLTRIALAATVPLALALTACAPTEDPASTAKDTTTTADAAAGDDAATCAVDKVKTEGTLTVGTDSPAYDPWFSDDDPSNGKGFESAVAYAVAQQMGYEADAVKWIKVPFNNSYAPGKKDFDFDINQISVTPERAKVVDFSDGYYSAAQAIITLKKSPAAKVASLSELADLKLGAQTGTTSLTAIRDVIKPSAQPMVFNDTNAAKQALNNGQLDAIVAALPPASSIT